MPIDPFTYYRRLQRAQALVEAEYQEPISLRAVARAANMEEKAFSR